MMTNTAVEAIASSSGNNEYIVIFCGILDQLRNLIVASAKMSSVFAERFTCQDLNVALFLLSIQCLFLLKCNKKIACGFCVDSLLNVISVSNDVFQIHPM